MSKATVIDGKAFSENLVARVAVEAKTLAAKIGRPPALAVVLVGDDPASAVYVRNKIERTTAAGMRSIEHRLDATASQTELLALIDTLNEDDAVDGIRGAIAQLPHARLRWIHYVLARHALRTTPRNTRVVGEAHLGFTEVRQLAGIVRKLRQLPHSQKNDRLTKGILARRTSAPPHETQRWLERHKVPRK